MVRSSPRPEMLALKALVAQPTAGFVVKNTFIDVPDAKDHHHHKHRRSTSVPHKLRYGSDEEGSTSDGSEGSGEQDASWISDRAICRAALSPTPTKSPTGVPPPPKAAHGGVAPRGHRPKASAPPAAARADTQVCRVLRELRAEALPSSRLSVAARPWHPSASPAVSPTALELPFGQSFADHVARVVESASASLSLRAGGDVSVQAVQDRRGWSIIVRVPPWMEDAKSSETLLAWTKAAVLNATEQSACVYVMGYLTSPFRAKQNGFGAVLGLMSDEGKACWDVYERGYCHRGLGCRWQHPASVRRLYVVVRRFTQVPGSVDCDEEGGSSLLSR